MTVDAIEADIDDDGSLRVDVLQNSKDDPIDILLSMGVLVINKKELPIIQAGVKPRVIKGNSGRPFRHICPKRMHN